MKKGFTLVEMLAVILLLGIVIILLIPAYTKIYSDIRRDNYEAKITEIEVAAAKYASLIKDEIKDSESTCVDVSIEELIKSGYLVSESDGTDVIYDPTTNEELKGTIKMCYCITTYDVNTYYTQEFIETNIYRKGDKVYYDNRIYQCNEEYKGSGGINATYIKNGENIRYFEEIEMCELNDTNKEQLVSFDRYKMKCMYVTKYN